MTTPTSARKPIRLIRYNFVVVTICLLVLNGLLSFSAWWPTVAVVPDARIAPEFIVLLATLAVWTRLLNKPRKLALHVFAIIYFLFIVGRYVDVVTPSLFGREINLYWDVPQLPRFLWVTAKSSPWWATVAVTTVALAFLYGFHRLLLACITRVTNFIDEYRNRLGFWLVITALSALAAANYAGVQATWPYVSKPVIPVYSKQFGLLIDAFIPSRVNALLPKTTVVSEAMQKASRQQLSALKQRDVFVLFLESYGAVVYDHPLVQQKTQPLRDQLQQVLSEAGRGVVSAFFTSPTVGGASDLAHLSVLSGINLSDPRKHDILLTTKRPTLIDLFQKEGYEVDGVYHSVWWPWAEKSFYGFDNYIDGPALEYSGPEIGYWKIPDQVAMAKYEQMFAPSSNSRPRFSLMFTITSHFPFNPTPPYQPDWERLLTDTPYDEEPLKATRAQEVNWRDMLPGYLSTINYTHQWLSDYFAKEFARERVFVVLGDHQPTATVTGENASWDVPVFIISEDQNLLNKFKAFGFTDGLTPQRRESLGGLNLLTEHLLEGFSQKN